MTPQNNSIQDARNAMLMVFADMAVDADALRELVAHARSATPDILQLHRADATYPGFETERPRWSEAYYLRQKFYAGQNFSPERLEHLIDVRDHLRQQCVKNFTAQPTTRQLATIGMNHRSASTQSGSSDYRPSENLKRFVEGGELQTIRAALRFELNDNRLSRQHLLDALEWACARVEGVCEPYAEKAFARAIDHERKMWSPDYYDTQTGYLKTNFSSERYHHLVDVRIYLRERRTEGFVPTDNAIGDTSAAAYRSASIAHNENAETPARAPRPTHGNTAPHSERNSPLFKVALLVGGALAAAVILLSLMR